MDTWLGEPGWKSMIEPILTDSMEERTFLSAVERRGQEVKPIDVQFRLNKVDKLDLTKIKAILRLPKEQRGEGWDEGKIAQVERHYKMFLKLNVLHPGTVFLPTPDIDHMWHWHVLFTIQYRRDCEKMFGQYLDHHPMEMTKKMEKHIKEAYQHTRRLFKRHFNEELPSSAVGDCWCQIQC